MTHTQIVENLQTGTITSTTTQRVIPEGKADYGVTVVGHSGQVLATRKLIAVNASGDVGTLDNPLIVEVNRDQPVVVFG